MEVSSDGVGIGKARRRFGVSKRRGSSSCAARWLALATERLLLHGCAAWAVGLGSNKTDGCYVLVTYKSSIV